MLKIIDETKESDLIIEMKDMKPLQVGVVVSCLQKDHMGSIVLRTQTERNFEVMNLSIPQAGFCWDNHNKMKVKLLPPSESIKIELYNE